MDGIIKIMDDGDVEEILPLNMSLGIIVTEKYSKRNVRHMNPLM